MKVAIPKEISHSELRVALVPAIVPELTKLGCTVLIENGAGIRAGFTDHQYQNVLFHSSPKTLFAEADIILKVQPPQVEEINLYKKKSVLVSFVYPIWNQSTVLKLCENDITSFAIENIPRISRAQSMDALSSQATVSGYKATLLAANLCPRFFPMLTTAAGTIKPAQVLVIGAGVAGLQAIATARRLGAMVRAYDIRAAAREQVESLGAKMIATDVSADAQGGYARELTEEEKTKQATILADSVAKSDVVICTALIPGKPAPRIITVSMVEKMNPGSLIIDIAAETGGNCELTKVDQLIKYKGVDIYGPTNLPSQVPGDASFMYSKNLIHFLKLLIRENQLSLNWEDEILAQTVLTHQGIIKHKATSEILEGKNECLLN